MDERIKRLSSLLTEYSCRVQQGENVCLRYEGEAPKELILQLIRDVYRLGARPFVIRQDNSILRELLLGACEEQLRLQYQWELARMKHMDVFIDIRSSDNIAELSDVPEDQLQLYDSLRRPVDDERIRNTRWVVLKYPTPAMAQLSGMSIGAFEDFYFDVCTMDYAKMSRAMNDLVKLMEGTDQVWIKGPGTDLRFSIKGIPAIKCDGDMNVPDGEVFTAPVRDSVNGMISYNVPSEMNGFTYENVSFEVKNGQIVKAKANDIKKINALLDIDDGARFFGEFALGVNPYILAPMKDILFDEKICGSFHLTPGDAYEEADNGNRSALHWDLVQIQRPEYGGGEIWFDDVLIRRDGLFVPEELKGLNPENLK